MDSNITSSTTIRRELRRSSQVIAFKAIDQHVEPSQSSEIEVSSSLTSDSDSSQSEISAIPYFPRVELNFENFFQELMESKDDFDALDLEFLEKDKVKIKQRSTQSILPGDLSIFTQTGSRSYVKIAKECYDGEEIIYTRNFISLTLESLQVFHTASDKIPEFRLVSSDIKEIIDSKDGKIKIIYIQKDFDRGMVICPITSAESIKWSSIFRNVSKIKNFIYKTEGTLPTKRDDDPSFFRHKYTMYQKLPVNNADNLIEEIHESIENASEIEDQNSEKLSEKSWNYNFDELDNEKSVYSEDKDYSVTSDDHATIEDEKTRTLTMLANLGISEGLVNLLTKGGLFLKYGRWGKPHTRHILATADLKYLEWWHINQNNASGNILVINIISVQKGRDTKIFKKFKNPEKENESLSLICKSRTIDLEIAKDNHTALDVWIMAFEHLIKHQFKRDQVVRYITKKSTRKE